MNASTRRLELVALPAIPLVEPGDNLPTLIADALGRAGIALADGDVIALAQKVVSKAEGRYAYLDEVTVSPEAARLAEQVDKDPRLVEVILSESRSVMRHRPGLIITAHRLGHVMANAGVDHSNIHQLGGRERVLMLPRDPDASCARLKRELDERFGADIGVVMSDSVGRPWRVGIVGLALGTAGLPAVRDLRGDIDLFGRPLRVTQTGFADQLACAATLLMGEAAEASPVVWIGGLAWEEPACPTSSLIRAPEDDLFR